MNSSAGVSSLTALSIFASTKASRPAVSHLLIRLAICASYPAGGAFIFLNTSRYAIALSVFFGSLIFMFFTKRAIS